MSRSQSLEYDIEQMCKGGAEIIQIREKKADFDTFCRRASCAKSITKRYGTKLIINDNVAVAHHIHADGVHLGQDDDSPRMAREILGKDAIIGLSVQTMTMLESAKSLPIDYIGCGAVFPTQTHTTKSLLGIKGLQALHEHSPVPVVAIGGIHADTFKDVASTGVESIAMVTEIIQSENIAHTVQEYRNVFCSYSPYCDNTNARSGRMQKNSNDVVTTP